ncbi:MAG TPA: histidine--tRNA ligase [Kineosporiaceae bacterium]|nr:histidine--tRNA ligase [Kineosporiaceae bacterium]
MSRLVRPQTLRGFRDLLPEEMLLRNEVVDRIRRVYESFGFVPLDTPVLESLPTLIGSGGDEADKQIFHVTEAGAPTPEDGESTVAGVGMRFDLTVPFARIIAQYHPQQLRLPFRRYHIGQVFRADEPQPEQGRFRQFTQFDCDIAGSSAVAADAEIVAVMVGALEALGLQPSVPLGDTGENGPGYFIRVNNRKLVDAFLAGLGITEPAVARHVLRVLDKADKISGPALRAELGEGRFDQSGDRIPGVGLAAEPIAAILDFAAVRQDTRAKVVDDLAARLPDDEQAAAALAEVRELLGHLEALGVSEAAARFDPSLARGLAYYTGTVYEGTLAQAGVGSVIGGGRYDGLVSRFSDEPVAAVGASIGLDRLITGLRNLGIELGTAATTADVIVLVMPGVEATHAARAAHELRQAGLATELFVGEAIGKVGKQLAYANAQGFRAAVMIGSKELKEDTVTVKDLRAGIEARTGITDNSEFRKAGSSGQQVVPRSELVATVSGVIR